jgi:hypothetical protein
MWLNEKSPRYPKKALLGKIREKYGIDEEWLMYGKGDKYAATATAKPVTTEAHPGTIDVVKLQNDYHQTIVIMDRLSRVIESQQVAIFNLSVEHSKGLGQTTGETTGKQANDTIKTEIRRNVSRKKTV